jgi:hypothetical protein
MLCFGQVATNTEIRTEQYLRTTFEHDAKFPRAETVDGNMTDDIHACMRARAVANIRAVDPATKRFSVHAEPGLQNVSSFHLGGNPFQLTQSDLFADL